MGAILSFFSSLASAASSLFGWLKGRQDASAIATQQQAGAIAQSASGSAKAAKVATAEGQAVIDTPADAEGLAKIADKGQF